MYNFDFVVIYGEDQDMIKVKNLRNKELDILYNWDAFNSLNVLH